MSTNSVNIEEVDASTLEYLSPLTVESITSHTSKGRYGVYQDGYTIVFTLDNEAKTRVQCLAKRKDNWFAQLHAIRIKNPSVKKFSFTTEQSGELFVNGVLA